MTTRRRLLLNAWLVLFLLQSCHVVTADQNDDGDDDAAQEEDEYNWQEEYGEDMEEGPAFFMDGAPGCSSDGYGITIDNLYMECYGNNPDGPCFFDDYFTIYGSVTAEAQLPTEVEIIPRICRRNGYTCTEQLLKWQYISLCDYLEDEENEKHSGFANYFNKFYNNGKNSNANQNDNAYFNMNYNDYNTYKREEYYQNRDNYYEERSQYNNYYDGGGNYDYQQQYQDQQEDQDSQDEENANNYRNNVANGCGAAGTYFFSADLYMPSNDITDYLYEWAQEKQEEYEENQREQNGYYDDSQDEQDAEEQAQQEAEENCEDDDEDCKEQYEYQQQFVYGDGTVGKISAKFQVRVELRPIQDLTVYSALYNGQRWYGYENFYREQEEEDEQDEEEQEEEDSQEEEQNEEEYGQTYEEAKQDYNTMIYYYMNEPTRSIYCHIPFRLVTNQYNVTGYKQRTGYYHSWFYRFFMGMLSDCEIMWNCDASEIDDESQTYYYASSVGLVSLLGGLYGIYRRKKRGIVTAGEEALMAADGKDSTATKAEIKRPDLIVEGDNYITMT